MNRLKSWCYLLGGILMYSLSLALFLTDNRIAAGGLAGIAVILNNFLPIGVGVLTMIMNVPILIIAVVVNGWSYTVDTVVAAVIYSFLVEILGCLPTLTGEPLVAAVFGGAMYGVGMTLLTIGGRSLGGTDLICRLFNKRFSFISVAKLSLIIDGSIILMSMVAFGNVEVGLYAIITIFVCSVIADSMLLGIERGSICMMITRKDPTRVAEPLQRVMGRTVTLWEGRGMYTGEDRHILLVALRPKEVPSVKRLMKDVDENAFVIVIPANELVGGKFNSPSLVLSDVPSQPEAGNDIINLK